MLGVRGVKSSATEDSVVRAHLMAMPPCQISSCLATDELSARRGGLHRGHGLVILPPHPAMRGGAGQQYGQALQTSVIL